MTLKRFTVLYAACLILSSAVTRKGLVWLRGVVGSGGIHGLAWVLLIAALGFILYLVRTFRVPWPRLLIVGLTFAGISLFLAGMRAPEERIHIFQYGLLGFLLVTVHRDKPWVRTLANACLLVLLVACVDELFQVFLPDRVGDIRDVGFGGLGGAWGAVVAALTTRSQQGMATDSTPSGSRRS